MKSNKNLGDVLEIKDLTRSKMKITPAATINELPNNYFVTRIKDNIAVLVGADKAHFLNVANAAKPEIIGSVALIHDKMYANQFLGIHANYALFSIAYQGVEIVEVDNLSNPRSLGLNKMYGFPYKMLMANNLAITNINILDITDIFNPKVLKEFKHPSPDYLTCHESLVYLPGGVDVEIISLTSSSKFNQLATLRCPFHYGFSKLEMLDENYLLAASGNGIAITEVSTTADCLEFKALVNLDIIPEDLFLTESSCITRTIRNPDDVIVSFNLSNPAVPALNYSLTFDTDQLWYFMANKDFIICQCTTGLEKHSSRKSVLVLSNHPNFQPEVIGEIKIEMSAGFWLIDNCIYEFTKEGMNIFEVD